MKVRWHHLLSPPSAGSAGLGSRGMAFQAKPLHVLLARHDSRYLHTSFGHTLHKRMTFNDEQVNAKHHIPSVACTAQEARLLSSRDGRSFASTRATIYAQHSCTNVTHATPWTGNKHGFQPHLTLLHHSLHFTPHTSRFTVHFTELDTRRVGRFLASFRTG